MFWSRCKQQGSFCLPWGEKIINGSAACMDGLRDAAQVREAAAGLSILTHALS